MRKILKDGGYSWIEDIRDRVNIARALAKTENEFVSICMLLDLKVKESAKGDYLFVHPEKDTWKTTGGHLGYDYSKSFISTQLLTESITSTYSVPEPQKQRAVSAAKLVLAGGEFEVIGRTGRGSGITASDIADMLKTNQAHNITRPNDYQSALVTASGPRERADITKAYRVASEIGYFDHIASVASPRISVTNSDDIHEVTNAVKRNLDDMYPGKNPNLANPLIQGSKDGSVGIGDERDLGTQNKEFNR